VCVTLCIVLWGRGVGEFEEPCYTTIYITTYLWHKHLVALNQRLVQDDIMNEGLCELCAFSSALNDTDSILIVLH
jgi:hypothetical protein